jgi:hypothetical protein
VLPRFAFETTAFDRPLLLLPNCFSLSHSNSSHAAVRPTFPFTQHYAGSLYLLRAPPSVGPTFRFRSFRKNAKRVWHLSFNISTFSETTPFSQLRCFGNSSFTRWCDMRRVSYFKSILLFHFPMLYQFPSPFLTIGARAPPFDIQFDRLYREPVVTHTLLSDAVRRRRPVLTSSGDSTTR